MNWPRRREGVAGGRLRLTVAPVPWGEEGMTPGSGHRWTWCKKDKTGKRGFRPLEKGGILDKKLIFSSFWMLKCLYKLRLLKQWDNSTLKHFFHNVDHKTGKILDEKVYFYNCFARLFITNAIILICRQEYAVKHSYNEHDYNKVFLTSQSVSFSLLVWPIINL